jgi:hypothetical protein
MTMSDWERYVLARIRLHRGDVNAAWQDTLNRHASLTAVDSPSRALRSLDVAMAAFEVARKRTGGGA